MALGARRRATAARTYKLCSLLLQYPDDEQLRAGQTEIVDAVSGLPALSGRHGPDELL